MATDKADKATRPTKLQALLRRMQAVILARRVVYRLFPPSTAALLDLRLRMVGVALVAEMQRLEGKASA